MQDNIKKAADRGENMEEVQEKAGDVLYSGILVDISLCAHASMQHAFNAVLGIFM